MRVVHNQRLRPLIGRECELRALQAAYDQAPGQLALVWGRRRIGKSYLLEHFTWDKPSIFYQATQQAEAVELEAFTRVVASALGTDYLPNGYSFPDWETALTFIHERNPHPRLVLVLDEFPYLIDTTPALPSILQRWWDKNGRTSRIVLVLCGSAQTFMESLDGEAAPLHQRFTRKIHVGPLNYLDAAKFAPNLAPEDCARVYAVLGGTPLYLEQWNPNDGFTNNLMRLFGDPTTGLVDSAELALTSDLPDGKAPYRVMQAIGLGKTRFSEIRDYARVTSERALQRLIALQLIERRTPATEVPERTKRSIYAIKDPYFRFFFRFISRNRGEIDRGFGERVLENQVLPYFDDYMGFVFEDIARQYVRRLASLDTHGWEADRIGQWWSTDGQHEIDVVGTRNIKEVAVAGTVKWRKEPLDRSVLNRLNADLMALGAGDDVPRLLIGRGGMAKSLHGTPRTSGVSIADIYKP